jgi:hypothetical protein
MLIFGFLLGAVIRSTTPEIFVVTATYAAVLVVFEGTNGTRARWFLEFTSGACKRDLSVWYLKILDLVLGYFCCSFLRSL